MNKLIYFFVVLITSSIGAQKNGSCNHVVEDGPLDFKITKQLDIRINGKKWDQNINNIIKSNIRDVISENPKTNEVQSCPDIDVRNGPAEEPNVVVEWTSEAERKRIIKQLDSITGKLQNIESKCESRTISGVGPNSELCERAVGISKPQYCVLFEDKLKNDNVAKTNTPKNCKEIQETGQNKSGIYQIQPKGSLKPFWVLCDMETRGGGWTVFQKRFDGSENFYREWRDYKFGFGDLEREFWLGLEHIYHIVGFEVSELLVELTDRDKIKAYAHYKAFGIGPETAGYPLDALRGFTGDAGDSLTEHLGSKFSTKDMDQDSNGGNCAEMYLGGWWYKACHVSNLNGKYINLPLPEQYKFKGLHWLAFRGHDYCHAGSRMLLKPSMP